MRAGAKDDLGTEGLVTFEKLLNVLPLEEAMPDLAPRHPRSHEFIQAVEEIIPVSSPVLQAALWLYVDDLDRSHRISQSIEDMIGAYWHGIMHRREGDFSNAKYWFSRASGVDLRIPGYEPSTFVDQVAAVKGENPIDLVEMQRHEWKALFTHCVRQEMKR